MGRDEYVRKHALTSNPRYPWIILALDCEGLHLAFAGVALTRILIYLICLNDCTHRILIYLMAASGALFERTQSWVYFNGAPTDNLRHLT